MAVLRLRVGAVVIAAAWMIGFLGSAEAQAQSKRRSGDGPNQVTHTDVAAGQMVDSLFTGTAASKSPKFRTPTRKIAQARRPAPPRGPLTGKLVRNPDASDGTSKYALVDRYGGVLRYVEPVSTFNLEDHLGEMVIVRHDAGDVLLASQLDFPDPTSISNAEGNVQFDSNVQLADFEEELVEPGLSGEESIVTPTPNKPTPAYDERSYQEGAVYSEGQPYMDEGGDYCGCPQCGSMTCNQQGGCALGARGIVYARMEYLLWDFKGFFIPPLVVEGDAETPDPNEPPVFADAVIVYGNEEILDGDRDGLRFLGGIWLDDCGQVGIEGDYVHFDTETEIFVDGGDGVTPPFVGRPFIDATTGLDAVEDVSFPGIMGTVTVESSSEYESAGVRLRHNICCTGGGGCGCGDAVGCGCGVGVGCGSGVCGKKCGTQYADVMFGFRYSRLDESLIITEDLETVELSPSVPAAQIFLQDRFFTENQFLGGEIGFAWECLMDRWSLELLSKVAIGNNKQEVHIHGVTQTTFQGVTQTFDESGLLVQPTNAGDYERNKFVMIPEVGATIGYQLTPRLRLTAGYSVVYWGNVVRPGDQIDLEVNPTYLGIPRPNPLQPPFRPQFAFNETDFWAHGLSLGGEMRW